MPRFAVAAACAAFLLSFFIPSPPILSRPPSGTGQTLSPFLQISSRTRRRCRFQSCVSSHLPFLFVCLPQIPLYLLVPAVLCVRFVLWNRDPFLLWFRIVIVVVCHFFPFPKAHLARHSLYIGCLDLPWSDICFIFWSLYAGPECRLRQALVLPLCAQLTAALCAVLYRCAAVRAYGSLPVSFCAFQPPFIPRLRTPYHV